MTTAEEPQRVPRLRRERPGRLRRVSSTSEEWPAPADDPETDGCDESEIPPGPSVVQNELTKRFRQVALASRIYTLSPVDIAPTLREMEQILVDRVVFIPLVLQPAFHAYRADILGGTGFSVQKGTDPLFLRNVDRWYRADRAG